MPVALSSTISLPSAFQDQLFDLSGIPVLSAADDDLPLLRAEATSSAGDLGFGILSHFCGPELIDRILDEHGRTQRRDCRLPARVVVYACLLMSLKPNESYEKLMVGLGDMTSSSQVGRTPTRSAFAHARERLGWEVMERLFRAQAHPIGESDLACCFWRGRRVMAIDGTSFELPSSPELDAAFGGQKEKGKRVGPPLLGAVSVVECGTRVQVDAEIGAFRIDERELAAKLTRSIAPGMLILADRNFFGGPLWKACIGAGADLVWRIKSNVAIRVLANLGDASYLAAVGTGKRAMTVRVIEYTVAGSEEIYRLATNLLDPELAPAPELARLYAQRWEVETSYREIKSEQLQGTALRSRTEQGVRQELWSVLVAYNISRRLCYQAAMTLPERDPDRISFSLAQNRIRSSAAKVIGLQVSRLSRSVHYAVRLLAAGHHRVERLDRSCPRVVRHRRSRFPSRSTYPGPLSSRQSRVPEIYTLEPSSPKDLTQPI